MRRLLIALMVLLLAAPVCDAQKKRTAGTATTASSTKKKPAATSNKKPAATSKKPATASKKKPAAKAKPKKNTKNTPAYTNESIRGLQDQRSKLQKQIRQQEQALKANRAAVAERLKNLMTINSEIDRHQKNIDGIQDDITHIEGNLDLLNAQLRTLEQQLAERKAKYVKSMRYLTRQHTFQDRLMFILSAKNFAQMFRRLRFVREYAAFQRAQGDAVRSKQEQVNDKHRQLQTVKGQKNVLLSRGQREREALQGQQDEQKKVVATLQNQQRTIQQVIDQRRRESAALNAQIDKLIAEEAARVRARAEAEARRKAEAERKAAERRAAELARKKAEAEAAARENERRIAEARRKEEQMRAEARAAAARSDAEAKARAEQAAREAEAERAAAERKARADEARSQKEIAEAKRDAETASTVSSVDRMMSNGFEANRGRLPMPITGSYRIVSHFGQNNVEGLRGVTIDNKGINILGSAGCQARSIYDGEVSAVFGFGGTMVVMVRHGVYISVYCNLSSVSVHRGQKVSTRQTLGAVGPDHILQFQLRRIQDKLNPEAWLGR